MLARMAADWSFVTGFKANQLEGPFASPEISSSGAPASYSIETANSRPGSGPEYVEIVNNANDGYRFRETADTYARATVGEGVTVGCAAYISDSSNWQGVPFRVGATSEGTSTEDATVTVEINPTTQQVRVSVDDTQTPSVSVHDDVVVDLPVGTIPIGEWFDLELYVEFVDAATGVIRLGINGVEVFSTTTQNTWGSATNGAPAVGYGWTIESTDPNATRTVRIEHVRIGHGHGGLLGQKYMEYAAVDGTADEDTATAVGAASSREAMDENPVNTADYADFTAVGNRFRCGVAARTLTGDIDCVTLVAAGSVPSGSATLTPFVEEGATETDGTDMVLTATPGTRYRQGPLINNPRTGVAWTGADYTAMTIGAERTA